MRILYVVARESRFTQIDRDILRSEHEIVDWVGRHPVKAALGAARAAARADLVLAWFAGWHAFVPITVGWLLRKPTLVITGGYDVADVPEAGYGMQSRRFGRFVARWSLRRARRLMANSESGRREALRAAPGATIDVVHHGVPDLTAARKGTVPDLAREGALTVGVVDVPNLRRKGLLPFVQAAEELPDVPFVVVGKFDQAEAERTLREVAGDNVELTGFVDDDELARRYAAAAVYVQASRHEGFGMSVAEAMLAGCVPVVTDSGALPEVVGDAGVVIPSPEPAAIAEGVRTALGLGPEARAAARERVLERFTLDRRAAGLHASVAASARKGTVPDLARQ